MLSRFAKAFLATVLAMLLLTTLAFMHPRSFQYVDPWSGQLFGEGGVEKSLPEQLASPSSSAQGKVIMPKLGNATAKAALGRATWKLMHTMTLRFPEHPTSDERAALNSFFHLTARLYPCGECAEEFQLLLKKFPPQTRSRRSASLWLCHVHNEVNARLKKTMFDCANLSTEYDCGCGDEPLKTPLKSTLDSDPGPIEPEGNIDRDDMTGASLIKGGR